MTGMKVISLYNVTKPCPSYMLVYYLVYLDIYSKKLTVAS